MGWMKRLQDKSQEQVKVNKEVFKMAEARYEFLREMLEREHQHELESLKRQYKNDLVDMEIHRDIWKVRYETAVKRLAEYQDSANH